MEISLFIFAQAFIYLLSAFIYSAVWVLHHFKKLPVPRRVAENEVIYATLWTLCVLLSWHVAVFLDFIELTDDDFLKILIGFLYIFTFGNWSMIRICKIRPLIGILTPEEEDFLQDTLEERRSVCAQPARPMRGRDISTRAVADAVMAALQQHPIPVGGPSKTAEQV